MRGGVHRRDGWWGISFVLLLFLSAGLVSLPASDDPARHIRDFYAAHRSIIVVAQALGVLAILPYMGFVLTLHRQAATSSRSRRPSLLPSGALVSLATLGTTVPVLALALISHPSLSETRTLARATDITDAVLFAVIALFAVAVSREVQSPRLRLFGAAVAILTLARAIISPLGVSALDVIAPVVFLAYVLAISFFMLARPV
jgi:hypothetical protein